MTAENTPAPDGSGPVDWDRYETELGRDGPPDGTAPRDADAEAAEAGRVLVDSPEAQRPARPGLSGLRAAQRRPILPAWLRSRAELGEACRWAAWATRHHRAAIRQHAAVRRLATAQQATVRKLTAALAQHTDALAGTTQTLPGRLRSSSTTTATPARDVPAALPWQAADQSAERGVAALGRYAEAWARRHAAPAPEEPR